MLIILTAGFVLLHFLRDALNSRIFSFFLRLTKKKNVAIWFYSFLFFPGVVVHEMSHWVAAKLLGVRTHHFSLAPHWVDEANVRLGYVETTKTDKVRTALIGVAPLVTGSFIVGWLAFQHLQVGVVMDGVLQWDWQIIRAGLLGYVNAPDVALWTYLLFAISNSMMPSASDRTAWVASGILFFGIYVLLLLLGAKDIFSARVGVVWQDLIQSLTNVIWVTVVLDFILYIPLAVVERLFSRR